MSTFGTEASRDAYLSLKSEGELDTRRDQVRYVLDKVLGGDATANEIKLALVGLGEPVSLGNNPSITTRLSELERMDLVKCVGRRVCSVTGQNIQAWVSTHRPGIPLPKRPTKDQQIAELQGVVAELRRQVEMLEEMVTAP